MGSKRTPWLKLGHPMSNQDTPNASQVEQRILKESKKTSRVSSGSSKTTKDFKSELQGASNSITPNPLFIQEPQTPITVLSSAAEAKPVNLI